jgi:hypothetical protein
MRCCSSFSPSHIPDSPLNIDRGFVIRVAGWDRRDLQMNSPRSDGLRGNTRRQEMSLLAGKFRARATTPQVGYLSRSANSDIMWFRWPGRWHKGLPPALCAGDSPWKLTWPMRKLNRIIRSLLSTRTRNGTRLRRLSSVDSRELWALSYVPPSEPRAGGRTRQPAGSASFPSGG